MMRIEGLAAGYRGFAVIEGVSTAIRPQCLTALIGPNGSGKSTLLKAMANLLPPMRGLIELDGRPLTSFGRRALAREIAYLPQARETPNMTVRALVGHGRYPHLAFAHAPSPEDLRAADEALAACGMAEMAARSVRELSGGERQRAYIAMLLAQGAPVMLLDEPTTHLDLRHQFDLLALLSRLKAGGKTLVVALHDLSLAMACADDVLLMERGRVLAHGRPEEVFESGALQRAFEVDARRLESGEYLFSPPARRHCDPFAQAPSV